MPSAGARNAPTSMPISARQPRTSSMKYGSAWMKDTSACSRLPLEPMGDMVCRPPSTLNHAGLRCSTLPPASLRLS